MTTASYEFTDPACKERMERAINFDSAALARQSLKSPQDAYAHVAVQRPNYGEMGEAWFVAAALGAGAALGEMLNAGARVADREQAAAALHQATIRGHARCVELLLAAGVDACAMFGGMTPIDRVARNGKTVEAVVRDRIRAMLRAAGGKGFQAGGGRALVTPSVSAVALRAHNLGLEFPTGNDEYNRAFKLGTRDERLRLQRIAHSIYGVGGERRTLTRKEITDALRRGDY